MKKRNMLHQLWNDCTSAVEDEISNFADDHADVTRIVV